MTAAPIPALPTATVPTPGVPTPVPAAPTEPIAPQRRPMNLVDVPAWDDAVDTTLVCVARRETTHDIATFTFAAPQPRRFEFLPGQYLTIGVDIDGRRVERCYSISSPPTRPYTVSITVKRIATGAVSTWLHDHLYPGGTVHAAGPLGGFTCLPEPGGRYLLVSAGSGITPMLSMVRTAADLTTGCDIAFVHSARTPSDIAFRAELDHLAADRIDNTILVGHTCTRDSLEAWDGHRGRLTGDLLLAICPDHADREIYLCGPDTFRRDIRDVLIAQGISPERIHEESYVLAAPPPPPVATIAPAAEGFTAEGFTIEFTRRGRSILCPPDTSILDAAAAAGIMLPSSCGQGMCGTCKVGKTSGEVQMNHNGGIRPREILQGKVLLCCSIPTSSVVLDS